MEYEQELVAAVRELKRVAQLSEAIGASIAIMTGSVKLIDVLDDIAYGKHEQAIDEIWACIAVSWSIIYLGLSKTIDGLKDNIVASNMLVNKQYRDAVILYKNEIQRATIGTQFESTITRFI